MTVDEEGNMFTCEAGRKADFGGKWLLPCTVAFSKNAHHLITAAGEFVFCEAHMQELIAAGLITDPYISAEGAEKLVDDELKVLRKSRPLFGPWGEP